MAVNSNRTVGGIVDSIAHEAVLQRDVPPEVAAQAARATLRALGHLGPSSKVLRTRCSGYFWAVVRRRLIRHGRSSSAMDRLVLATVIDDLMRAGRDSADVWREIERGWSQRIPREILEECRARLCA